MDEETLSRIQIWLMAIRPKTLPAAISPVIVGTALAVKDEVFTPLPAIAALLGALLLQIAANLANDYSDHKKGTDPIERIGPTRVVASGLMKSRELLIGLVVTIIFSLIIGVYLILVAGMVIFWIGIFSIIALLTYSGGAIAFGYRALGDLMVFIFFGFVAVMGSYYIHSKDIQSDTILASIPTGALITAILVVNNYRDLETDRNTGKTTMAVLLGEKGTKLEFLAIYVISYAVPLWFMLFEDYSFSILLPFFTLPFAYKHYQNLFSGTKEVNLNKTLAGVAKLGLSFNILFSVGILL